MRMIKLTIAGQPRTSTFFPEQFTLIRSLTEEEKEDNRGTLPDGVSVNSEITLLSGIEILVMENQEFIINSIIEATAF